VASASWQPKNCNPQGHSCLIAERRAPVHLLVVAVLPGDLPLAPRPPRLYLVPSRLECRVKSGTGAARPPDPARKPEIAMSWTDERVETLKKMWAEGQSASQIAKELGGVTRNAVIGKVHRLGLSNRAGGKGDEDEAAAAAAPVAPPTPLQPEPRPAVPAAEFRAAPERAAPERAAPPAGGATVTPLPTRKAIIPAGQPLPPQPSANEISPEALASVREVEKRARRLTLMELTERTCKWPIGDPATDDFWFCGLPTQAGKPYCDAHVGVAFQPMSARRDRRR
jgi:GcrA cell cycle regulator